MVGSSAAGAAVTKATNKRKQPDRKREKTRAEKDAHNLRCVRYRKNKKMRLEELEKMETDYNQMRDEKQRTERELEDMYYKIQCKENENQILRRALEKQAANEARIRQIPTGWNIDGQNFSSFDELEEWCVSQKYEQVSQGANHGFPNVFDAANNHDNIGMLTHNFPAGVLSNSGASSSGANADLPSVFYTPSNHDNNGSLF